MNAGAVAMNALTCTANKAIAVASSYTKTQRLPRRLRSDQARLALQTWRLLRVLARGQESWCSGLLHGRQRFCSLSVRLSRALAARRSLRDKICHKIGLNFKISYYAILRAELIAGAQRMALNLKPLGPPNLRDLFSPQILYRQLARAA